MAQININSVDDARHNILKSNADFKGLSVSSYCKMVIYDHLNKQDKKE